MSQNQAFNKLVRLLKELFQLDQPDLDFGLYRIMHARAEEITRFLDHELLPQVREAFSQYRTADKAELEKELQQAIEQANSLGVDPESTGKVKELRQKIAEQGVDISGLEREVYDHLYKFFRRYYQDGDFLAKRVYKPGVYAIPYEGEEVKLHWANKDQYYIKTSEYLREYTFLLQPGAQDDPMRVHFRLVDATEGEHGNIKANEEQTRVFILARENFIDLEDGEDGKELVINFEYRPATLQDWSEEAKSEATAAAVKKPPTQKVLCADAVRRIMAVNDEKFSPWLEELSKTHIKANGERADYNRLTAHLNRYTARNTFDYFIHKDLGGFLRRELDFYIKNEVMHLDDIENETAPRVEQYLSKIKVIRQIAGKIIDFLAQLEDFQKKLWLKKKFVTETSWCIRVGCIPEEFYPEIAANDAQRQEWVKLHAIDEFEGDSKIAGYSEPLTTDFLRSYPTLMIDTQHFDENFTQKLLEAMGDIDEQTDGFLFNGDNFQALKMLKKRFYENIKCIYIDPPFNTDANSILYKNNYPHSSWLSLMRPLLSISKLFEEDNDGVHIIAIDKAEHHRLTCLLEEIRPEREITHVSVVHNPGGTMGKNFSQTGEYALFVYNDYKKVIAMEDRDDNPDVRDLMNTAKGNTENYLRHSGKNCFYPVLVKDMKVIGFGEVPDDRFHPEQNVKRADGTIELYPIDNNGIERKWVLARSTIDDYRHQLSVYKDKSTGMLRVKRRKDEINYKTIWTNSKYSAKKFGSELVSNIVPAYNYIRPLYPKSIYNVRDCVHAGLNNKRNAYVLDYFAGSGTTGHAAINLNREDEGTRKFILVEMGSYFDTIMLRRLKKITFTPEWQNGKPKRLATNEEAERSPRIMKVVRLESYEDTLNNLEVRRAKHQKSLLEYAKAQGEDKLREKYFLRYMLNVETRGSRSLLNIKKFADPTAYKLKVKRPGSEESREVNVDLLETFNWLIGLTVQNIAAPQTITAEFTRDNDPDLPKDAPRRLLVDGRIREDPDGSWWFRTVTGITSDKRKTLVIWRKLTGDLEKDNLVLDEWFKKQGYSSKDSEFDLIYVNGDNNLENLHQPDDTWKVRLIEEDFHRLMFEETED